MNIAQNSPILSVESDAFQHVCSQERKKTFALSLKAPSCACAPCHQGSGSHFLPLGFFHFLEFHVNGVSQSWVFFFFNGYSLPKHSVYSWGFFLLFPKHFPDPFGGDPFKESDPFRGSAPDDFFKKQTKSDPFTSDPFTKNPSLPSKVSDLRRATFRVLPICMLSVYEGSPSALLGPRQGLSLSDRAC